METRPLTPQTRFLEAKFVRQGDALMAYAYLITEAIDSYGTILSIDGARGAAQEWAKWRNLREMHDPKAVGTVPIIEIDDIGLKIGARVIDPEAIRKVEEGVYKGVSVGFNPIDGEEVLIEGKYYFRFTKYDIVEASLVDRPANPEAVISIWTRSDIKLAPKEAGWMFDWASDADAIIAKLGWAGLERACAWHDKDKTEDKKGYRFPVAKLEGDGLTLYYYGVVAAMAALNDTNGGTDIPEDSRKEVHALLSRYFKLFEEDPPELRMMEERMDKSELKKFVEDHIVAPLKRLMEGEKKNDDKGNAQNVEPPPKTEPAENRISLPAETLEAAKAVRAKMAEAKADEADLAALDALIGRIDPVKAPEDNPLEKRLSALEGQNSELKKQLDEALADRKSKETVGNTGKVKSPYGGAFIG